MFSHLTTETLHHAYLIEGDATIVVPQLEVFLESVGISVSGNPNVFFASYESFLIDDAHDIKQRQIERSEDGGKKIFIITTPFINHYAQNALLKTFEEPAPDTHFFLIMPSISSLYGTLVSRFLVLQGNTRGTDITEAQAFLTLSIEKRILFVADIVKAHEDDENSGALRAHATTLLSHIEQIIYQSQNDSVQKFKNVFTDISCARMYLTTAGASVKMILEQIALVAPIVK